MLFDYAENGDDPSAARGARELIVVRSDRRVLNDVVGSYLRRVDFGDDGYARLIRFRRTVADERADGVEPAPSSGSRLAPKAARDLNDCRRGFVMSAAPIRRSGP